MQYSFTSIDVIYLISSIAFFTWVVRNIFFWVALWQLKEYRFDRVFIHIKETRQGFHLLFSPLSLVKIIAICLYGVVLFNDQLLQPYQLLVVGIYIVQAVLSIRDYAFQLSKKPVLTYKALFILFASLAMVVLFYAVSLMERYFWLLLIDKAVPLFVMLFVFFLSFPTEIQRDMQIEKATKRFHERRKKTEKNLLVIGVTGSFGKSSTKEYIAQILSKHFSVLKTKGTNNTPIGIANTILHGLSDETDIFVVEMGAYKKGEIAYMCQIVRPDIGILTAVNDQHASLFGNIQNTMQAKYELITSLPKDGLALFNGNNLNAYTLYKHSRKRKILYGVLHEKILHEVKKEVQKRSNICARNIDVAQSSISFDINLKNTLVRFTAPLLGAHTIENILPGIYIADMLGMTPQAIQDAVAMLIPVEKTMIRKPLENGVTIIDDTFNANPEAALAAVSYMQIYKGKKILVLQPMIELGRKAYDEHYRVAKAVAKRCTMLLLTNKNFHGAIEKGIRDGNGKCKVSIGNATTLATFLSNSAKHDDIIVFEGKEAQSVLEKYNTLTTVPASSVVV